jgi:hypothetical protein
MAAYQQTGPARTGIVVQHGSEDGMRNGGRQPPAPEPSGRQVSECGGPWQDQLPRRQLVKLGAVHRSGVHTTRDAFPFAASQPSACGSTRVVVQSHAGRFRIGTPNCRNSGAAVDEAFDRRAAVEPGQQPRPATQNWSPATTKYAIDALGLTGYVTGSWGAECRARQGLRRRQPAHRFPPR